MQQCWGMVFQLNNYKRFKFDFAQLQNECSVFLSEDMVRYESPELSLEMIPAKQRCNLVYKDFQNFNVELVEKLYDTALKSIIDLQHEIANYSN